ncbi:ABC transporter permease [Sporosarcina sp. Marseille-Q4063]|uniref:ABC transporter permease n=1 Tax=Sporosarcina sp. Marseille-Q4063 TaxID=2810514 RepID=UPI002015F394|nr:ABC transporter permease [Sporosarcina sp. Marseille-Q4063]
MAFIFGKMGADEIGTYYIAINLTMVTVAAFVQCSLIAEEKEKNTLRGLMLSPASTLEILGGKSLLSLVATLIMVVVSFLLMGYQPKNTFVIAIAIILSAIFFIILGTLLGLLSKSVMEASVLISPFMLVFGFGSMFTVFADEYPILKVMDYTPNIQLLTIAEKVESGIGIVGVSQNLGIIAVWIIVISLITIVVFKKRMTD